MKDLIDTKIVVTGGAGFIGSHIVEHLVESGVSDIVVVDDLSTGYKKNIEPFLEKITLHEGSITDVDALTDAFRGAAYVFHQAAIPSVPRSIANPRETHDANTTGTLNVFLASRDAGVKRVVYASSSAIYGDTAAVPTHEDTPINPLSPYAAHKAINEYYGRLAHELFDLETVGLRYFNVFGERQDPDSPYAAVIPLFARTILRGEQPTIFGDGETTRDFTHVTNVVDANLKAAVAQSASGKVFNIACGEQISLNDLVRDINSVCGTEVAPVYADSRAGDIKHSCADITKAEKVLSYTPEVSFREGLQKTIASLK